MTRTFVRTGRMVERKIRDEHILVPIGDNLYELDSLFTLNETASFVWSQTVEQVLESSIVEGVMDRYEVDAAEAEADTNHILSELVEIGALTVLAEAD